MGSLGESQKGSQERFLQPSSSAGSFAASFKAAVSGIPFHRPASAAPGCFLPLLPACGDSAAAESQLAQRVLPGQQEVHSKEGAQKQQWPSNWRTPIFPTS